MVGRLADHQINHRKISLPDVLHCYKLLLVFAIQRGTRLEMFITDIDYLENDKIMSCIYGNYIY